MVGQYKDDRLFEILDQKHRIALTKTQELYEALNNLHYEGKVSFGRNIKEIEKAVRFFRNELSPHIRADEEVVFPYLSVHVPRLDPMLRFLSAEHNELKIKFKDFEHLFRKVKDNKDSPLLPKELYKLRDEGTYLFCLLRNHIQTESAGVYQVIASDLTLGEKKVLLEKYSRFNK